jgi:hypothetical protein
MDLDGLRAYPSGFITQGNYQCPACDCRKSGDVNQANSRDEWCAVYECPCHNEDL